MEKRDLRLASLPGYEAEIGRWLWCLEDVRRTIISQLTGVSQAILDTKLDERQTIGSLLYHIALVEADWLYEEVLVTEWDPEILALFPEDSRSGDGSLTHVAGQTMEEHLDRLNRVRQVLLSKFRTMDLDDWRKPRILEKYDVTPEWVIYHLLEHESHHRGQIFQQLRELRCEMKMV
ncbi:DinB family protein [Peribacillus sp. SI8-4]|uniref:DinB family protein n=1 Tax=Peribacillus sp. SI8-4 TaxID=3048009 RepID=UPI002554F069|nr:DinB family protein [Peribacillus sp. SI8-4]